MALKPHTDRQAILVLAVVFCALYAYFFQGGGWNQNAHFDTVRALVEQGTNDITAYAANTGDTSRFDNKVYSNKGPGLALAATPVYFVLYHIDKALGRNAGDPAVVRRNAHVLSFFVSAVPAALIVIVLFLNFRRSGASLREGLVLAGGFGAGSLALPYSGLMMSHVFTACTLFSAWHLVSARDFNARLQIVAGILTGFAILIDLLAAPVVPILLMYVLFAHRERSWLPYLAGGAIAALALGTYDWVFFGKPWLTHQTLPNPEFQRPDLVLGMLEAPELRRIYWLTIHPFRGLFYCCPLFFIPILSWPSGWTLRELTWEQAIPFAIIGSFSLFMLCFNGWTGGWCVGPRYMLPALPFLFAFALRGYRKCPVPSLLLISISTLFMLCVSAVKLMVPAANYGPAPNADPIGDSLVGVVSGTISTSTQGMLDLLPVKPSARGAQWASYNLGEVLGLSGARSLLPALVILGAFACIVALTPRQQP